MTDLAAFLAARLDEDDAEALKLHKRRDGNVPLQRAFAARMLREVAAKRAILAEHAPVIPDYGPDKGQPCCGRCGAVADDAYLAINWPCDTILALAAVYSAHPDYGSIAGIAAGKPPGADGPHLS